MSRTRVLYRCAECGADHPKWVGQCAECRAWATLEETTQAEPAGVSAAPGWSSGAATPFSEISAVTDPVRPTGVPEFDRALGGGLVPGSVTLLGGEPGIGKSTLLLQLADAVSSGAKRVLYVSAEESATQLRRRADRLELPLTDVWVQAETSLGKILDEIKRLAPDLLLVDSIQTVAAPEVNSVPGSVTQVRSCAQALLAVAKQRSMATVLVGHVTKDGSLAGPRTLEHLVDTVLSFEGDSHQRLRFLRASKHRFGPTGEPGVLDMTANGLQSVDDPSEVFLADRQKGASGSVVVPVVDGQRPLLVELQALVVPSQAHNPRRAAQGVESGRVSMLLAVLERRCGIKVLSCETYVSVVGGIRVAEPGADLAIALAVASAVLDRPLRGDIAVCGEVGLAGELRQVSHLDRRLAEVARLGYRSVVVPASVTTTVDGVELIRAATVSDAMRLCGLASSMHAVA